MNRKYVKSGILVLITLFILILVIYLISNGCSQEKRIANVEAVNEVINRQVLELMIEPSIKSSEFINILNQELSINVIEISKIDGQDVAVVNITAPDVASVLEDFYLNHKDEEMTYQELKNILTESIRGASPVEKEVVVNIYKENGAIEVEFTEDFINAMYGGIFRFSNDFFREISQEVNNAVD
ncbi:hypothetical protein MFMK1_000840 [Metallumcola ferriviriculae]|uniref:Uncharacterized protein n=1 Tax=Metallumcola ferriviriculae TaxID=3039180 RepID=A0AAU0ULD0_9FIRM|nr:hypothetical protein MFMK1_000840 [Desulfitibacteraceae bacterium MK1]